jgi:hypothetical protein
MVPRCVVVSSTSATLSHSRACALRSLFLLGTFVCCMHNDPVANALWRVKILLLVFGCMLRRDAQVVLLTFTFINSARTVSISLCTRATCAQTCALFAEQCISFLGLPLLVRFVIAIELACASQLLSPTCLSFPRWHQHLTCMHLPSCCSPRVSHVFFLARLSVALGREDLFCDGVC